MPDRRCIKCAHTLELRKVLDVEVDFCPSCRGLWLDEGEVSQLASDRAVALAQLSQVDKQVARLSGQRPAASEAQVLATPCPACGGKLAIAAFGPISIELCNACGGIFLDRGELDKAIALVQGGEAATIVALARSVHTSGTIG
jgi:hypothetical protein